MLKDYNQFDYELLLKRARIRQCLMKYDEAALDANLALNILPQKLDAYNVLLDFLVASNNYTEALKILEILYHYNPDDPIIKGQYEQIREKERKKKGQSLRTKLKYDGKNSVIQVSSEQLQKLIKEYSSQQGQVSQTSKLDDDEYVYLSDELETMSQEEEEKTEKPGNAQHLETPRVIQQLDFKHATQEILLKKKKEAYKMKQDKLGSIDCQLCKLVFDYTSTCQHYSQMNPNEMEDLKELMPSIQASKDLNAKRAALQKVTKTLDVLSTFKITSLTLLQGQFSEIIALYLKRDLSAMLGGNSDNVCTQCVVLQTEPNNPNKPILSLAQHALILVNRSLTFQQQALMLNETADLVNVGGLEEDKTDFGVDSKVANSVLEELKAEIKLWQKKPVKSINFQSLHFLTRALTNILILTRDQTPLFNQIRSAGIIKNFLELFNNADQTILKEKSPQAAHFCMFFTHALRFFIVCSSIDSKAVTFHQEPSLKQVLRKYELYLLAFLMNEKLFTSLKADLLYFKHSSSGCHMKTFYKEVPMKVCANCDKQSTDLKICSRCMKVYYCGRDCQKAHYPQHKQQCLS